MNNKFFFISIVILILTGCAQPHNVVECLPVDDVSGFWSGTWHGITSSISFIGSLIFEDIAIYEVNNNGPWYDFGFVGGLFIIIKIIIKLLV